MTVMALIPVTCPQDGCPMTKQGGEIFYCPYCKGLFRLVGKQLFWVRATGDDAMEAVCKDLIDENMEEVA